MGINAHLLSGQAGYRRAGIHHYIAQLLNHLPSSKARLGYTIFTNDTAELRPGPATAVVPTTWPTERRLVRILWEQLAWPLAARQRHLDLLHSLAFVTPLASHCPTMVTVYDLSFIYYPENFPAWQRLYLTSQTRRSCRQARRVVTIAESGRQDVHRLFDIPRERIDVVRPGVDAAFSLRPAEEVIAFRQRQELPERFILHVGTLQPRKNIPALLEALARLKRPEIGLVLVGGKGWFFEEIFARVQALGLGEQVRFAGYVSDEELPLWYNAASLLVFPSLYEGFGMPVVQAMACGTPVIAAETSAVPEVTGEAALLFHPQDASALANHLASILDDPQLAATLRQRGLLQAQQFSWELSGQQMAAIYESVLAEI
ncbi:MAG: glycosyltransferase family 4 protein [Chloroflexi bacterium]|nr:glycosyltransferase family 4 protein [Chloroflexota bacterium]MCI0578448.1 glycosyltransferase family 4 protein [Chloroflexota bacterium]MCI0643894.1 glycosyltransferase family 4 protein [Chloroflexota bacterium]MCI0729196.1 glycosyltransferase family 4 protein [Chloroflexota bacterium]